MQLTLYYFDVCLFCELVQSFMAKNHIALPMRNTHKDHGAQDELIRIGGKPQVPCLVIDGKALYESLDIIEWLKKNYKK